MSATRTNESISPEATITTVPARIWANRIITGLLVLFLLSDAIGKIVRLEASVEGTVDLGYPDATVIWIGMTLLLCTLLYVIPRTAILGAVLLTGYLGGAIATQVSMEEYPWLLFPLAIGILLWAALYFRDGRLRSLIRQ